MTPPHSPDEAIYHLSVAKRFVEQGRVFPVIDNWAGNMPFLIPMVYAVCLMARPIVHGLSRTISGSEIRFEMGRENYPNVSGIAPTIDPDYQPQLINWATLDQYSTKFLVVIYNDRFGNIVSKLR